MHVEQFYDEGLAHASYAVISGGDVALIDPGRDPKPYYRFADTNSAKIVAVIETHLHADFISSHLEFYNHNGITLYVSKIAGATYPHQSFDEGSVIKLGQVSLTAIHTPGHSPDSISILLKDENGRDHALFTGDTLFVGDIGRPDLREKDGDLSAQKSELARLMYRTVQTKLKPLSDDILVYPAHGAGSLCGKNLSDARQSTIGEQRKSNWAFDELDEKEFVETLLEGQPYIPKYFSYAVELNRKGAPSYAGSIAEVPILSEGSHLPGNTLVIDTRKQKDHIQGHVPAALNIMNGTKFETWVGSLVAPEEKFYLVAASRGELDSSLAKLAKIGYEKLIVGAVVNPAGQDCSADHFDLSHFASNPDRYTILDIRSVDEHRGNPIFSKALNIPLQELRERIGEIPVDKPVVVHCAGGYRSAIGASMLRAKLSKSKIFDLSDEVSQFEQ